jgi:hypothetical protein
VGYPRNSLQNFQKKNIEALKTPKKIEQWPLSKEFGICTLFLVVFEAWRGEGTGFIVNFVSPSHLSYNPFDLAS